MLRTFTNLKFNVQSRSLSLELANHLGGVPQGGSVLSITCFAININDISEELSKDLQCTFHEDGFNFCERAITEDL